MNKHDIQQFLEIIRQLVQTEFIDSLDTTVICYVQSTNDDGTLNLYIEPDMTNVVHNVVNMSPFTFSTGDKAILYKRRGRISDSFVIAKNGATMPLYGITMDAVKYIQEKLTGSSTQTIEINNYSGGGGGGGGITHWSATATTQTGEPGSQASVGVTLTQSGDSGLLTFSFIIPQGPQGVGIASIVVQDGGLLVTYTNGQSVFLDLGLATVATTGDYNDLINKPEPIQDLNFLKNGSISKTYDGTTETDVELTDLTDTTETTSVGTEAVTPVGVEELISVSAEEVTQVGTEQVDEIDTELTTLLDTTPTDTVPVMDAELVGTREIESIEVLDAETVDTEVTDSLEVEETTLLDTEEIDSLDVEETVLLDTTEVTSAGIESVETVGVVETTALGIETTETVGVEESDTIETSQTTSVDVEEIISVETTTTNSIDVITTETVELESVTTLAIDTTVTEDSSNLITSGAVYDAVETRVPQRLSVLPTVQSSVPRANILLYTDVNNTSAKISVADVADKIIQTSSTVPQNAQQGQYIFLEIE